MIVEPPVPYLISWNLTQRCNLRCRHCYIDAAQAAPGELTETEARRVLDEIAAVNADTMLILTGGEPLCRPDLEALVAHATARGLFVVLGTNATGLTASRARALAAAGARAVGVSLDAATAPPHDAFRGMPGAWIAAKAGIVAARAAGLEVQVQCTLTRDNVSDLDAMVALARGVGARVLTTFFLVCTGRGQGLVDLSPQEYETALRRLADFRPEGIVVRPRCAPTFRRVLRQTHPDSILLESDAARCLAARHYCRITPTGDVTPCPYLPAVAGNLRERSFGEIWRESPLLQSLRTPRLSGRCGVCEHADVCGGCRARAFAHSGDVLGEDPWCVHEPGSDAVAPAGDDAPIPWDADAETRLGAIPFFVRSVVRRAVERAARQRGAARVTLALMHDVRTALLPGGPPPIKR